MNLHLATRSAITYPLALLIFLALLTFWINRTVQPEEPRLDGSSRHDADYIMSNFVTTQTDINGDLRYKLASTEMKHFPNDDTTELERPRYTQFATNKPYTQVQALRGRVSSDGEQVQLTGNVKLTRQAFADKGEMTLETDYLNILPNEDLVRTDSPVVIRQAPKTVIYATGMLYEKKMRTVTLLNKVRAHYERPSVTKQGAASNIVNTPVVNPKAVKSANGKTLATNKQVKSTKQNKSNTNDARIRRRYE